jgi:hypothetical protein
MSGITTTDSFALCAIELVVIHAHYRHTLPSQPHSSQLEMPSPDWHRAKCANLRMIQKIQLEVVCNIVALAQNGWNALSELRQLTIS